MLKVAVIGVGYIGKVHLETLKKIPGVQIAAVADKNLPQAQKLAAEYGIPVATDDYIRILADPGIGVIHNCTPNFLHFEINEAALQARKHVLSEKPLAVSTVQAGKLCALAAENDLVTGINFCYRYYPALQEAAARIRNGEIGKVHTVIGSYLQDWLLYETDYNWRLNKTLSGPSNTAADIGSHWCDLAQFVTGMKITEVMAEMRTIIPVRKKSAQESLTFGREKDGGLVYEEVPVEVDDYTSVLIRLENGAGGAFTVCQLCAGRKCTIDLQIYGTKAALAWNHEQPSQLWQGFRDKANEILIENPLLLSEQAGKYALLPAGHPLGYHDAVFNLFSDFYKAVHAKRNGQPAEVNWPDFQSGYEEMLILDAIMESSQRGEWVKVKRSAGE